MQPSVIQNEELLESQYKSIARQIEETQKLLPMNLSDVQAKADKIYQDFLINNEVALAVGSFNQLSLDLERNMALKKIELMCTDLQKSQQQAEALDLNVERIGKIISYVLENARGYLPTATKIQIQFHELAARHNLLFAKSELIKHIAGREMENIVHDIVFQDPSKVESVFQAHMKMLHLSEGDYLLSPQKIDEIMEDFLDDLAFLEINDKAIERSNNNKIKSLEKMTVILIENPTIAENERSKTIFFEHIDMLMPQVPTHLMKAKECQAVLGSLVNKLSKYLVSLVRV